MTLLAFHTGQPCTWCSGIGDMWRRLDAAGKRFAVYSVDNGGIAWEAGKLVHADPIIYRQTSTDYLPYEMDAEEGAGAVWAQTLATLPSEMRALKGRVWLEIGNEPDKTRADWIGRFYVELATLAARDGYRICGPAWSGGEPEPADWRTPGMLAWLRYCAAHRSQAAVSLHEYSFDAGQMGETAPWLIGRVKFLFDICREYRIDAPDVFITEFGWTQDDMPDEARAKRHILDAMALYAQYPTVKAAFLWTLVRAVDSGMTLGPRLNALMPWVEGLAESVETADPPPADDDAPGDTVAPGDMSADMTTMLALINEARAANGLPPYEANAQLTAAATRHAWDIATNDVHTTDPAKYHVGTDGSSIKDRVTGAGYPAVRWGEVTGWGFGGDRVQMLNYWLNSPAHRALVLSADLTQCGIVLLDVPGSKWRWYWVIDFGRPKGGQPPPPPYQVHIPMVANDGIDLLDYIRGDGRIYEVRHHDGSTETFQTQRDGNDFWQVKNHQWEHLRVDGGYIWRGVDTSPGPLHGRNRAYIQWESGYRMARWGPQFMTVGQTWTGGGHHVEFRFKDDCSVSLDNSGGATNKCTLVRRIEYIEFGDMRIEDVIELHTHTTGETMFYARGYGLVAWRNAAGQSSEIVAVYGKNERADLVREKVNCFD